MSRVMMFLSAMSPSPQITTSQSLTPWSKFATFMHMKEAVSTNRFTWGSERTRKKRTSVTALKHHRLKNWLHKPFLLATPPSFGWVFLHKKSPYERGWRVQRLADYPTVRRFRMSMVSTTCSIVSLMMFCGKCRSISFVFSVPPTYKPTGQILCLAK